MYDFNDPEKDVADLQGLIDKYQNKVPLVISKTVLEIRKYMENAGVTDWYKVGPIGEGYAFFNSADRGGNSEAPMDFWKSSLINEEEQVGISEQDAESDKGSFFIFSGVQKAYNPMDAGNYLWGLAMRYLDVSLPDAKFGAHSNNAYQYLFNQQGGGLFDSKFDQQAIEDGWNDKGNIKP